MTLLPDRSRLALLLLPTVLLGAAGAISAILAFGLDRFWMAPLWLLFALSYGRMALSASGPLVGLLPAGREPALRPSPRAGPVRTALLLPVFNEPPEPIHAAVRIMAESLDETDGVTVFVLSDTQDAGRLAEEARLFPSFMRVRSGTRVHYRHRSPNTGRKAGNIGAFCREHGHEYDFAIVLDADSLMTGSAIRELIAALRDDPRAALIQSVSYPAGGTTLFARLQQFGARLNTPLSVAGQHSWQGRHGTYWGHNAILRLDRFIADAALPVLRGRPPFGGEILCHDTIEAALLLRAGSAVRLAPEIGGSFETTPSNLVDHLARERRWCQGNLQHLRLLGAPRFRPASRVHIGMGILYYLASPVGLLISLLLLAVGLAHAAAPHRAWAMRDCLWLTLFLLFAPKLASLGRALLLPGEAWRGFGGRGRLVLSVLAEQVLGMLYAPIVAVSVTGFVIDTFRGRTVGWSTQARGDRPVGWTEAVRRFRAHTAIGMLATLGLGLLRPGLLPWTLPFLGGLVLSIPLACCSGSIRLGALARRFGLFLTVDELAPLPEQVALSGGPVRSVGSIGPRARLGREAAVAGGD